MKKYYHNGEPFEVRNPVVDEDLTENGKRKNRIIEILFL